MLQLRISLGRSIWKDLVAVTEGRIRITVTYLHELQIVVICTDVYLDGMMSRGRNFADANMKLPPSRFRYQCQNNAETIVVAEVNL